jgi:hypothetical protein
MFSVVYLLLCVAVGLAGRRRRIGFAGFVLLALFLTPVVPLLYLLFTQKRFLEREAARRAVYAYCRRCGGDLRASATHQTYYTCRHCGASL